MLQNFPSISILLWVVGLIFCWADEREGESKTKEGGEAGEREGFYLGEE